jgi:hypothetical protein
MDLGEAEVKLKFDVRGTLARELREAADLLDPPPEPTFNQHVEDPDQISAFVLAQEQASAAPGDLS